MSADKLATIWMKLDPRGDIHEAVPMQRCISTERMAISFLVTTATINRADSLYGQVYQDPSQVEDRRTNYRATQQKH
jgi:hypothetical protein